MNKEERECVCLLCVCVNAQTNALNWFSLTAVLKIIR